MNRCIECDSTIKKANEQHMLTIETRVANMNLFSNQNIMYPIFDNTGKFLCCDCIGHETGKCVAEIERLNWIYETRLAGEK